MRDTIFAVSSGSLPAGVAIIRVSGPQAREVLVAACGRAPAARRATVTPIRAGGEIVDRGLVLWFPGPASFTGEDIAEFQVHGSRAVVKRLFDSFTERPGLRPAGQGEFTRRAFDNGRLDLTEVEGLADLIAAETEVQRRQASFQAGGALRNACEAWRDQLIRMRAEVEAELDFSDEEDVGSAGLVGLDRLVSELETVLRFRGERVRDGFRVALAGAPNSGKSSLLNALVGRRAAIVTAEPGTTRDVMELALDVGGYPVVIMDTAGLRDADSDAEREGVRRAGEAVASADLVLWLAEPGTPFAIGASAKRSLRVRSKADLRRCQDGDCSVSAVTGEGMDTLTAELTRQAAAALGTGRALVARDRQRRWLAKALERLREAQASDEPEVRADLLRSAGDAIGRISGRIGVEAVLDALFREFCIGK